MNRVTIVGRLGQNAEIRYGSNGGAFLTFSVAVTEKYKDKESTEWFRCVLFGQFGERLAPHMLKGCEVFVDGNLATRTYEKNGETRYSTEVIARTVRVCERTSRGQDQGNIPDDEDIPF